MSIMVAVRMSLVFEEAVLVLAETANWYMNIVNYIACFYPNSIVEPFLIYPELILQLSDLCVVY